MSNTPQNDSITQYRCSCGCDILVQEQDKCAVCGRQVRIKGFDPALTATLCAFDAAHGDMQDDRFGERLGHFQLKQMLGAGGMGAVYRALDTSLQRYVAVKVLRGGSGKRSELRINRLLQEAVAQARLNHANVVTIYYVGRHEEEPFLAMELLNGPTLETKNSEESITFQEVIHYGRQIVSALQHAEQLGLAHGDIKPSNLLLSQPGHIKLSDFGLARPAGGTNDSEDGEDVPAKGRSKNAINGTPNYLAPELVDGGAPNYHSDMYALGVTFFELTFGRRPFELTGTTIDEKLHTHHHAEIEFPERWPKNVPEQWKLVLERLLAKKPRHRYAGYASLDEDLQKFQPMGSARAARLPRVIAFAIDSAFMLMMLSMFILPAMFVRFYYSEIYQGRRFLPDSIDDQNALTNFTSIFMIGAILVPLLALFWDVRGLLTPGRYLMQLRIVDESGFMPSRRTRAVRSVLRNLPFWIGALAALPAAMGATFIAALANSLEVVWLMVDGAFLFTGRSMAFHDRICRTQVRLVSADESHANKK